jgi:hypothetical protein
MVGRKVNEIDELFEEFDLESDPLWRAAGLMVGAPPQPAKGYAVCSLAWLQRVLSIVRSKDQLVIALLIYSECLRKRSDTVTVPSGILKALGISRWTKRRAFAELAEAGVLTVRTEGRKSARVVLLRFP